MNKIIESYIERTYGFDVNNATCEDFLKVTEILVSDVTMDYENGVWDFSKFPNLRKIDCSYNPIEKLNISANTKLEYIRFEGARGAISQKIDFSGNPHLKTVISGQDGVKELDFSSNIELEYLSVFLSSSLRWLDIDNCTNLRQINMQGANIPFVDLTHCHKLEKVNIHYWNLYKKRDDEFGPGYPRPLVFVNEDFNEEVIDAEIRPINYYTYYLIRVKKDSVEEKFLNKLKLMKADMFAIPNDRYGVGVAIMHYKLLELYNEMKSE